MVRKVKTWGLFVRDFLLRKKEAYTEQIWREYNLYLARNGYPPVKYSTMRKYMWILRKLGLIELSRVEQVGDPLGHLQPRFYLKIVEGKENDPAWYNPQVAYNPEWGLGSLRYKRKGTKFFERPGSEGE